MKYFYIIEAVNNVISGTNSTVISGTPLAFTTSSSSTSSPTTISPSKSSPVRVLGVFLGLAIITGLRITKHKK